MEITTSRLSVRTLCEHDWMDMKNIFVDFSNSEYAAYDRPFPTDDSEIRALVRQFADSGSFFTVRTLDINKMIGYVCFHKDNDIYDVGYCFHSSYHGKGYAYESVHSLIEYISREYGIFTFTAGTAIDNKPSCRLLEKLGFVCVSTENVSFDDSFVFQGGNFELKLDGHNTVCLTEQKISSES